MTHNQLKAMANRIKQKRMALNFTQEQFSELIGITASSYTKIENAFQKPSLDTLIAISQKLNLSLDYIVFGNARNQRIHSGQQELVRALMEFADKDIAIHASEILVKISKLKGQIDEEEQA